MFPKAPKAVERLQGGSKWSWGADSQGQEDSAQPAAQGRLWNPRTGFMRTRAELEQEQAAAAAAGGGGGGGMQPSAAPQQQQAAAGSSGAGTNANAVDSSSSSSGPVVERLPQVSNPLQPPPLPPSALAAAAAGDRAAVPAGGPGVRRRGDRVGGDAPPRNTRAPRDRGHLMSLAVRIMRQVLIDHARERLAAKRGGGVMAVPIEPAFTVTPESGSMASSSTRPLAISTS